MANYKKISAKAASEPYREEIRSAIENNYGTRPPKLLGLLANDDPAAKSYADWTGKACEDDKIEYELREVQKENLEAALHAANDDPTIHGIIIYYPVFGAEPSFYGGCMDDYLRDSISPTKDVEGLCHTYRSNLYRNVRYMDEAKTQKCVLPCTPLSVVKLLESQGEYDMSKPSGNRLAGKTITVVNRSEVVGRPLAALLANDGATVYSVDIDSIYVMQRGRMVRTDKTQENACLESDVIVLGVPSKAYKLNPAWISPNTMIVNVASFKNVDEDSLKKIDNVKYVPLVGKMTVAMLERNLLRLYENFHRGATGTEGPSGSSTNSSKAGSDPLFNSPTMFWSLITCVACTVVSSITTVYLANRR